MHALLTSNNSEKSETHIQILAKNISQRYKYRAYKKQHKLLLIVNANSLVHTAYVSQ